MSQLIHQFTPDQPEKLELIEHAQQDIDMNKVLARVQFQFQFPGIYRR